MKKFLTLTFLISLAPLIAGLYGVLHDQITYSLSPEYYTKFKFYQFRLAEVGNEAIFPNPRIQVAIVGFLATWWMGLPIGLILGLVNLKQKDSKLFLVSTLKSILITMLVALVTGLIGFAIGKIYLAETGVSWWLPNNLIDTKNFIAVGSMHNFSYLGGLFGLIAGVIYSLNASKKTRIHFFNKRFIFLFM